MTWPYGGENPALDQYAVPATGAAQTQQEFYLQSDNGGYSVLRQERFKGPEASAYSVLLRKDGQQYPVNAAYAVLDRNGRNHVAEAYSVPRKGGSYDHVGETAFGEPAFSNRGHASNADAEV